MNISSIPYSGLNQIEHVATSATLPEFQFDDFSDEIDFLIEEGEYDFAKSMVNIALQKVILTGIVTETKDDYYAIKDSLEYMLFIIENIIHNLEDREDDESELEQPDLKTIIQSGRIDSFKSIEDRFLSSGCGDEIGSWEYGKDELISLIHHFDTNGFFKRRDSKGRWLGMQDYYKFFSHRYFIDLDRVGQVY